MKKLGIFQICNRITNISIQRNQMDNSWTSSVETMKKLFSYGKGQRRSMNSISYGAIENCDPGGDSP